MEDQIESGVSRLNSSPNPFKRRKFYRKREPDDGEAHSSNGISEPVSPPATSEALSVEELVSQHGDSLDLGSTKEQSGRLSAAEILRRRKSAQRKRMGVEFTTLCNTRADTTSLEPVNPPIEQNEPIPEIKTVVERFTPQTGQVADVNKHM